MSAFILFVVYQFRKKQMNFQEKVIDLQTNYDKNLFQAKLEIQEQTFQHISREIHDNINLSLSLAKLYLNTFNWEDRNSSIGKLTSSIDLITSSIRQLSDISQSLNSDLIVRNGLLEAIRNEIKKIQEADLFIITYQVSGNPIYMDSQKELIIFRIVQESFNNIIRHAQATETNLTLHYNEHQLEVEISDNGNGFDPQNIIKKNRAGLRNIESRIKSLNGVFDIKSNLGKGTILKLSIPI
jgi:two-component system NarL family sensor kinase